MITPALALAVLSLMSQATSTKADFLSQCELDGSPAWLQQKPKVDRLLVLDPVGDLSGGGEIRPQGRPLVFINADPIRLMNGLDLDQVDILLAGRRPQTLGFGPAEPGLYTLSLIPSGSAACAPYDESLRRARELRVDADDLDFAPAGTCVAYKRIGREPDLSAYSHFATTYIDQRARALDVFRSVAELRNRDGVTFARAVTYAFPEGGTCPANAGRVSLGQLVGRAD